MIPDTKAVTWMPVLSGLNTAACEDDGVGEAAVANSSSRLQA
jgi:hypothetical protein